MLVDGDVLRERGIEFEGEWFIPMVPGESARVSEVLDLIAKIRVEAGVWGYARALDRLESKINQLAGNQ